MRNIAALLLIGAASLCTTGAAIHAADAAGLLARARAASGAAAWDGVRSLENEGSLAAGGLTGTYHQSIDLLTGRNVATYKLGPLEGATGYDGRLAWERDGGGEVATKDSPAALRRARTDAWLTAYGYWFPARMPTALGQAAVRTEGGVRYEVVTSTPGEGDPVALWFAADTLLLARTVQREGADTVTTVLDDYREVNGVRLPFHAVTDVTDATGRTDPQQRTETRFARVVMNPPVSVAQFAVPEMAPDAAIDDRAGVTTLPFDLIGGHLYVDGRIDGRPVHLIVDTGGVNVLTPGAARRLGLTGEGHLSAQGVAAQSADVAIAPVQELRLGAAQLTRPVFYIIDMGPLSAMTGVQLDGLVGYEVFRRFGVQIDYDHRRLTLSMPEKFAPPAGAHELPFTLDQRTPVVSGTLDGVPIRMTVDTGSGSSLSLHSPFVRERGLIARYHAAQESVLGAGAGGEIRGRPARLGTLSIGGFELGGLAGELYTGDRGAFANPDVGGNLGSGVLHRFTVAFDYPHKRMYLAAGTALTEPDPYDRSGLALMRGDADTLEVINVAAGSAAEQAGVKAADRIVSIADVPVGRRSLSQWRELLRASPAGTALGLALRRGQVSLHKVLRLADRIPSAVPAAH